MESNGIPSGIVVSGKTAELIRSKYRLVRREPVAVKGKGRIENYAIHSAIDQVSGHALFRSFASFCAEFDFFLQPNIRLRTVYNAEAFELEEKNVEEQKKRASALAARTAERKSPRSPRSPSGTVQFPYFSVLIARYDRPCSRQRAKSSCAQG